MNFVMLTTSAKTLDESPDWSSTQKSLPNHLETTANIVSYLKTLSVKELAQQLQVSKALAETNHQRLARWTKTHTPDNAKPAILLYHGDIYKQFVAKDFSPSEQAYAQKRLRISSGQYGLIRPYDLIQPYRLEMRTKLKYTQNKAMNEYWRQQATTDLNDHCKANQIDLVVNLASAEYAKVIDESELKCPFVTIEFQEEKDGQRKTVAIFSKKARGMMVGYAIKHQITDLEGLKDFNTAGYQFSHADKHRMLFVRKTS